MGVKMSRNFRLYEKLNCLNYLRTLVLIGIIFPFSYAHTNESHSFYQQSRTIFLGYPTGSNNACTLQIENLYHIYNEKEKTLSMLAEYQILYATIENEVQTSLLQILSSQPTLYESLEEMKIKMKQREKNFQIISIQKS